MWVADRGVACGSHSRYLRDMFILDGLHLASVIFGHVQFLSPSRHPGPVKSCLTNRFSRFCLVYKTIEGAHRPVKTLQNAEFPW